MAKNRSLVLRQTPVWAQTMAGIFIALGTIGVVGGFLFKIDEVVTAQGQLQSIGGSAEVMTPAGGRVEQVYFKDGELVRKGKLLLTFDTREASQEAATLTTMIAIEQSELKSRLSTINSRRAVLDGRREVIQQKMRTKQAIVRELSTLVRSGGYQKIQYLEQADQLLELSKQISQLDEEKAQTAFQEAQLRLDSRKSIEDMSNRLSKARLQLQYRNVVAPVDGIVFDPKARPQAVIGAGERILTLVPQGSLYARVYVPNKDIGFIKPGQSAQVRVDAFPYARYGDLAGSVEQIGADALPPDPVNNTYRFPVKIRLQRSYLEARGVKIPLQSGMAITTNLKLREKRLISLISDLLVDQMDALRSLRQQ